MVTQRIVPSNSFLIPGTAQKYGSTFSPFYSTTATKRQLYTQIWIFWISASGSNKCLTERLLSSSESASEGNTEKTLFFWASDVHVMLTFSFISNQKMFKFNIQHYNFPFQFLKGKIQKPQENKDTKLIRLAFH